MLIIPDEELKYLQDQFSKRPLQRCVMRVTRLPPTILVTKLPSSVSEQYLELYFEKHGDGEVSDVQLYLQHRCAVITFKEEASAYDF